MRDFVQIKQTRKDIKTKDGKMPVTSVFSSYRASGKNIMKKGGKFYAILDDETGMWSTDESDVSVFIDRKIEKYMEANFNKNMDGEYVDQNNHVVNIEYLDDSSTNRLKDFNIWFSNLSANHNYKQLDTSLTFKDDIVTPDMYRSKRLGYNLSDECEIEAYEKIMSVLYDEDNRLKIEWCIGAVLTGASKKIEKMLVLYGKPGSGKSTVLDLIKLLFQGYWVAFVASELVNRSSQFSTAPFKDNPLVAIQDDGSLVRIDSPVINEIISHKDVMINEKQKQQYTIKANAMLFLATNDTVDIHDTNLGITRRLLDVYPSGNKIPVSEYRSLVDKLPFEVPGIAKHCFDVFKTHGKEYYEGYSPDVMINKTNYIRNFMFDYLDVYSKEKCISKNRLYEDYKKYCEDSGLKFPVDKIRFIEQIGDYFETYEERAWTGKATERCVYSGLKISKIAGFDDRPESVGEAAEDWLTEESLEDQESQLNLLYPNTPAQQATKEGGPCCSWDKCRTRLCDVDCRELHWFKLPENVIKIDFDLKDAEGNKSLELNLKAANKFPKTYAEVSKSGSGIHLYYIYDGDPNELSRIYDENIEVKVSTGNNSHRRILTLCNNIPVNHISTGLPLKEKKPAILDDSVPITVKGLRTTIRRCLAKEVHADTTSNVDWIYEILERAYKSGLSYDLSDLKDEVEDFCSRSTNQSDRCLKKFARMKFKSKSIDEVSLKGGKLLIDGKAVEDESAVRYYVTRVLEKPSGKNTFDELYNVFEKAYQADLIYDLSDVRQTMLIMSGKAPKEERQYCVEKIGKMKLSSERVGENVPFYDGPEDDAPIVFFDIEVFPNLIVVCWKYAGEDNPVMKLINPTPDQIRELLKMKLVGFNNRGYDNHILYAILIGKTIYEVYLVSKAIIAGQGGKFREAYNLSYTDIYDFSVKRQKLKVWEYELDKHHQEINLDWDEPVDESLWPIVCDYCSNDVIATEAVWNCKEIQEDWTARQILADLAGGSPNETTNNLTFKFLFGNNKKPILVYTDLATGEQTYGR